MLPSIFNAVILISVLSVGNSSTYGSSRTIAALASINQAPKIFGYTDRLYVNSREEWCGEGREIRRGRIIPLYVKYFRLLIVSFFLSI